MDESLVDEFGVPYPVDYDVACRREGCGNANIVIRVPADPVAPLVFCGACNKIIAEVVLVPDPLPYEPNEDPDPAD